MTDDYLAINFTKMPLQMLTYPYALSSNNSPFTDRTLTEHANKCSLL